MKQEVNRKHASDKWALDDVVMTSEVTHPPKVRCGHSLARPSRLCQPHKGLHSSPLSSAASLGLGVQGVWLVVAAWQPVCTNI